MRRALPFCLLLLTAIGAVQAQTAPPTPAVPAATAPAVTTAPAPTAAAAPAETIPPATPAKTYSQQDVLAAADDAFGKGAEGLADLVKKVFSDLGEPDGYIVGREAGGAIVLGVRYGSGTLFHKVEGQMPVFWTGPSVGFDLGADGSKAFIMVYHLHDSNDMFRRYAAVQGKAYFIGGASAQYLRHDDIVLVPVTLGVGWRLGVNAGWLNFTRETRYLPF